jgi:hypothetical protein
MIKLGIVIENLIEIFGMAWMDFVFRVFDNFKKNKNKIKLPPNQTRYYWNWEELCCKVLHLVPLKMMPTYPTRVIPRKQEDKGGFIIMDKNLRQGAYRVPNTWHKAWLEIS